MRDDSAALARIRSAGLAILAASFGLAFVGGPVFAQGPARPVTDYPAIDDALFRSLGIDPDWVLSARYIGAPGGAIDTLMVKKRSSDGRRIERRVFALPGFVSVDTRTRDMLLRRAIRNDRRATFREIVDELLDAGGDRVQVLVRLPRTGPDRFLNKSWFFELLDGARDLDDLDGTPLAEVRDAALAAIDVRDRATRDRAAGGRDAPLPVAWSETLRDALGASDPSRLRAAVEMYEEIERLRRDAVDREIRRILGSPGPDEARIEVRSSRIVELDVDRRTLKRLRDAPEFDREDVEVARAIVHQVHDGIRFPDCLPFSTTAPLGDAGSGVRLAIVEDGIPSVSLGDFGRPPELLSSRGHTSPHLALCLGVIGHQKKGEMHGYAPGAELLVGNCGTIAERVEGTLDAGANILSFSWHGPAEEVEDDLDPRDLYLDAVSREFPFPTVVVSAGNGGMERDLAAGKGYGILGVGDVIVRRGENRDFVDMGRGSAWRNPETPHRDRELPEIATPGSGHHLFGRSFEGTSAAAPVAAAVVARLMAIDRRLSVWPEANRAILMAGAIRQDADGIEWGSGHGDGKDGAGLVYTAYAEDIARAKAPNPFAATTPGATPRGHDYGLLVAHPTESHAVVRDGSATGDGSITPTGDGGLAWRIDVDADTALVRASLAWNADDLGFLDADLDLWLEDEHGKVVRSSVTYDNSYEVLAFRTGGPGIYTLRLVPSRVDPGFRSYFGVAWTTVARDSTVLAATDPAADDGSSSDGDSDGGSTDPPNEAARHLEQALGHYLAGRRPTDDGPHLPSAEAALRAARKADPDFAPVCDLFLGLIAIERGSRLRPVDPASAKVLFDAGRELLARTTRGSRFPLEDPVLAAICLEFDRLTGEPIGIGRRFRILHAAEGALERYLRDSEHTRSAHAWMYAASIQYELAELYGARDYVPEAGERLEAAVGFVRRAHDRSNVDPLLDPKERAHFRRVLGELRAANNSRENLFSLIDREVWQPLDAWIASDVTGQVEDDYEPFELRALFSISGGPTRNPMLVGDRPLPDDFVKRDDIVGGFLFDAVLSKELVDGTPDCDPRFALSRSFEVYGGVRARHYNYRSNDVLDFNEYALRGGFTWRPIRDGVAKPNFFIGTEAEYADTTLGRDSFETFYRVTVPSFTQVWAWDPRARTARDALDRTVLYHVWQRRIDRAQVPIPGDDGTDTAAELDRDGNTTILGARHYWYAVHSEDLPLTGGWLDSTPARRPDYEDRWFVLAGGLRYEDERARGAEFDGKSWIFDVQADYPLAEDFGLDLFAEWERGRNDGPTDFFGPDGSIVGNGRRDDSIFRYGAGVRLDLYDSETLDARVRLGVSFTNADSDDPRWDYDRSFYGLSVTVGVGPKKRARKDELPTGDLGFGKPSGLEDHDPRIDETAEGDPGDPGLP